MQTRTGENFQGYRWYLQSSLCGRTIEERLGFKWNVKKKKKRKVRIMKKKT